MKTKQLQLSEKESVMTITDKVKSFEDACQALGIAPKLPPVGLYMVKDRKAVIAFYKLTVIIRALNEGWEPNWNDYRERKWFVWLFGGNADDGSVCGLSASFADSDFSVADSTVGARLAFKNRELCDHARALFLELYKDYLLIEKE